MSDVEILYTPYVKHSFSLLDHMFVEPGTAEDWEKLHHLHYKTEGRPFGPRYYRLSLGGETIGCTVLTMPKGLLKERHAVFPDIKPGADSRAANTARYKMINANTRVVGRIVLDTLYRGVGASYRFQNLVARQSGFRMIEIQSAMSKYNLFAQRAGFEFAKPMRSNKFEAGVKFMAQNFRTHPADTAGILEEYYAKRPAIQKRRLLDMQKFYYANSAQEKTGSNREGGWERVQAMSVEDLLRNMQQLILAAPMYGVYINPDAGRTDIPEKLPLSAFDRQLPKRSFML